MRPGPADDLVGEGLHIVGAAPGIDDLADAGLVLNVELGIAGNAGGEVRRQGDGLIQRIGVQGLGMTQSRPHGLHGGAGNIVEGILGRKGPAGSLAVGAERHGLGILCPEGLDDLGPKHTGSPHLGHFHEVVLADGPEEGQALGKGIHGQASLDACADVLQAICQSISQLDIRRCPCLLHMVAGNGDAVEFRHVLGGVLEDIADDAHGHFRRVDVGVAHHEFLQDIVLDGAGHDFLVHPLLYAGLDEESQDGQHCPVHGHGHGHLVQGYAGEQDVHIQHGAHGHPRLAHITYHTGIIRIVAAMGGQVKGDGKALLACCQIPAVEGIGLLCRGEACVLAHSPGTENIHSGVRPPQAGRNAAGKVQMVHMVILVMAIEGLYRHMLHGAAGEGLKLCPGLGFKELLPVPCRPLGSTFKAYLSEIRIVVSHYAIIPFFFCRSCRIW